MRLENLKPEVQRALAIAIPVLVLLFSVLLTVPKLLGIWSAGRLAEECRQEAEAMKRENVLEIARQHTQRLAALPQSKDEQLAFLKEFSRIVAASGVRLVSYRPPASGSAETQTAASGSDPALIPVAADVTVSGSYRDQVSFFRTLAKADRLFALENLQMRTEQYPRLSATFRLVRYVTPVRTTIASREGAPQ